MGELNRVAGDLGQRYEVTFFNPNTSERQVLGWAETLDGAKRLSRGIDKHPVWEQPLIEDRQCAHREWTEENSANGWRSSCKACGLQAQGSGQ